MQNQNENSQRLLQEGQQKITTLVKITTQLALDEKKRILNEMINSIKNMAKKSPNQRLEKLTKNAEIVIASNDEKKMDNFFKDFEEQYLSKKNLKDYRTSSDIRQILTNFESSNNQNKINKLNELTEKTKTSSSPLIKFIGFLLCCLGVLEIGVNKMMMKAASAFINLIFSAASYEEMLYSSMRGIRPNATSNENGIMKFFKSKSGNDKNLSSQNIELTSFSKKGIDIVNELKKDDKIQIAEKLKEINKNADEFINLTDKNYKL